MKKILLLLTAGLLASAANGQMAMNSIVFKPEESLAPAGTQALSHPFHETQAAKRSQAPGQRTTIGAGGSRWYNYCLYQDDLVLTAANAGESFPYLWFDTSSIDVYTGGITLTNNLLTAGAVLDPYTSGINDPTNYPSVIAITPSYSYTVDSVDVAGVYGRNSSLPGVVDTLIFALVWGDGTKTSNVPSYYWDDYDSATGGPDHTKFPYPDFSTDTLRFLTLLHDSTNNHAGNVGHTDTVEGAAPIVYKLPLTAADANDTDGAVYTRGSGTFEGLVHKVVPLAIAPSPGGYVGVSVTFKSGDPTAPHMPPGSTGFGDTVFTGITGALYKHNMFRPLVIYNNTSGSVQYPVYDPTDNNDGVYKIEPASGWGNLYLPMYDFITSSGGVTSASSLQYPAIGFHVNCPTCYMTGDAALGVTNVTNNTNSVTAYPNPATSELNIFFKLAQAGDVSVSLTNMLGQVVETQNINNAATGKAVFSTSLLPDGMYIYTLLSGGVRSAGHVIIAH